MTQLPTWYFNCQPQWTGEHFSGVFIQVNSILAEYPQWQMTPVLKSYYLLHFAYWIQQFLVLALRLEKPRKDHTEYIIHHFVTIWMIGCANYSYFKTTVLTSLLSTVGVTSSTLLGSAIWFLLLWTGRTSLLR